MNNNSQVGNSHDIFKQGIQSYQAYKYRELEKYYISETIKLSLLTGPLYCLSANLQFLNNRIYSNSFGDNMNQGTKNIKTSISSNKAGVTRSLLNYPFRPSFVQSYRDCLFNLYRQGKFGLGFYKGNGYRLLFFTATTKLKQSIDLEISKLVSMNRKIKEIILYSLVDFILNPLLFLESRYSIQNRRKGFCIYENIFDVFKKSWKELYLGASYSIPRNVSFLLALNFYLIYPSSFMQGFSVFLAHLLSYPILTVQRNKIYHSQIIPYLPKPETSTSMFKYLINNYGFFSLYRGFGSYIIATGLWHYFVPRMAKIKFYKNALNGEKSEDVFKINFLEDDEEEDSESGLENHNNLNKLNEVK
jgi:hypothetical protein